MDNLTIYCYCNYPLNLTTLFAYSHTTVISIICTYTFPLKYRGKYRYFSMNKSQSDRLMHDLFNIYILYYNHVNCSHWWNILFIGHLNVHLKIFRREQKKKKQKKKNSMPHGCYQHGTQCHNRNIRSLKCWWSFRGSDCDHTDHTSCDLTAVTEWQVLRSPDQGSPNVAITFKVLHIYYIGIPDLRRSNILHNLILCRKWQ